MATALTEEVVSARTGLALLALTADILPKYLAVGGKKTEMEGIRDAGLEHAELLHGQKAAKNAAIVATADVNAQFEAMCSRYSHIMDIARVVRGDLEDRGGDLKDIAELDRIMVNEAAITMREVPLSDEEQPKDGAKKTKREARPSLSQEARRGEMARDFKALVALTAAHTDFEERGVPLAELKSLASQADEFLGKVATGKAERGVGVQSTADKNAVAEQQRKLWNRCIRLIERLAEIEPRVAALLPGTRINK